ncbi:MAG: hypothetical protein AAFY39_15210 [Pseudomonadota bacterium]
MAHGLVGLMDQRMRRVNDLHGSGGTVCALRKCARPPTRHPAIARAAAMADDHAH